MAPGNEVMPEVGWGLAYLLCSLETCSLSRAGSWQPPWLVPAEMAQHLWLWEQGLMWFLLLRWISPVAILGQKALKMGRRWRRADLAEKEAARGGLIFHGVASTCHDRTQRGRQEDEDVGSLLDVQGTQ